MARTLSEIYAIAKSERDKRLELSSVTNTSKMSVMDAFTWITSAAIYTFENLLDVFQVDVAKIINARINGTAGYYISSLKKFQYEDELAVDECGRWSYTNINPNKQIIKNVSFQEFSNSNLYDRGAIIKIAKSEGGVSVKLNEDELNAARAFLEQITFAGTYIQLVSREGDELSISASIYYDGEISEGELKKSINDALTEYLRSQRFNNRVYVQKLIDVIQRVEHVTDVWIDSDLVTSQGFYVTRVDEYNSDIKHTEKITERFIEPYSGYFKKPNDKDGFCSQMIFKVDND